MNHRMNRPRGTKIAKPTMHKLRPTFKAHFDKNQNNKLLWKMLSSNESDGAIEILKSNQHKINWKFLSSNSNDGALDLLESHLDNIDWSYLSQNPNERAVDILRNNKHNIDWSSLSSNSGNEAVQLLLENQDEIDWYMIGYNTNENALQFLENNIDKVYPSSLAQNKSDIAVDILEKYIDENGWDYETKIVVRSNSNDRALSLFEEYYILDSVDHLNTNDRVFHLIDPNLVSRNSSDKTVEFLRANPQYMDWNQFCLSEAENRIPMLEENPDKISSNIYQNKHIFQINPEWVKFFRQDLHEELLSVVMHPDNYEYIKHLNL